MNRNVSLDPIDLIPEFAFWRDGCRAMSANICTVLQRAGEDIKRSNILSFLHSLPRSYHDLTSEMWSKGYCHEYLEKAFPNMNGMSDPVMDYFVVYFPARSYVSQMMLIDAFIGILDGAHEAFNPIEQRLRAKE